MSAEQHDYAEDVFDSVLPSGSNEEDAFEPDKGYDYLDEIQSETQKFLDETTLSVEELRELFTPPNTKDWRDISPEAAAATVTFDSAKDSNWRKAKDEINHVKKSFRDLLDCEQDEDPNQEDIINLTLTIVSNLICLRTFFKLIFPLVVSPINCFAFFSFLLFDSNVPYGRKPAVI